jgi:hypothetical protein
VKGKVQTVCVVSHDAGGAEILASYVAQHALICRLVLAGPAMEVFRRRLGAVQVEQLESALATSDWCLLGTGWQSDLEWQALGLAKRMGKRTVTFIDHWVNYPERFERDGVRNLPDEIWVGDEDAQALVVRHFPHVPVQLVPNPYFADMEREFARHELLCPRPEVGRASALFVCENLSGIGQQRFGDARHYGYTEFEALEYFLSRVPDLDVGEVHVRPHPSDPVGKYDAMIASHAPLARLGGRRSLLQEIATADVVAGCESMALVSALIARRRVLCCVPPGQEVLFMNRRQGVEMLRDIPLRSAVREETPK